MAEYIERRKAVEWFMAFVHMGEDNIPAETVVSDLRHAIPAADVAPVRHGEWIANYEYEDFIDADCSVCGKRSDFMYKYCPFCGARMDGGDDNGE